jgi:hypothetical protein
VSFVSTGFWFFQDKKYYWRVTSLHHQTSPSWVVLEVSRRPFTIGVKHVHNSVVVWALMNFFVLLPLLSLLLVPKYKGVI